MSNIILPANSAADSGVELRVPNALNFMGATDNARFSRTNASGGSTTKATLSAWIKYSGNVSQSVPIFMSPDSSGQNRFYINITSSEELGGTFRDPDCDFSATNDEKLRDPAAWYHIVAVINTNDGTAADRLKIYVNNRRITLTFASGGGLSSGANIHFNTNGYKNVFGYNDITNDGVGNLTDMYFSEVIKCDGQVLAPTDFAETDSDTGIWVPKTGLADSLTFGTTGYYYNFSDSSDLANDASSNNNDASAINNTTQSLDTPSNNFATLNSVSNINQGTLSEGNLKVSSSSAYKVCPSTISVSSGKWYVENKITGSSIDIMLGVIDVDDYQNAASINYVGTNTNSVGYYKDGRKFVGNSASSYGASYTTDDIIGIALDLDSGTKTITFYKNNASQGAINLPTAGSEEWLFLPSIYNATVQTNFGNPAFTGTDQSDGNSRGSFEYAPPSGYLSLCTANLSESG